MGTTIEKCLTCKHAFTTGKDRLYCKKSLADKDDCGEYEIAIDTQNFKTVIKELPSVTPKTGHWIMPVQDDGMSDPIYYQVRCSNCGFDLDPQTWHMELHQYGADKFCPNCRAKMESEEV